MKKIVIQPLQTEINENDQNAPDEYEQIVTSIGSGVLENGQITNFYFQRFMIFEYACMVFALTSIVLSFFYYDADFQPELENVATTLLWMIFIISLIELILLYLRYSAKIDLKKSQFLIDNKQVSRFPFKTSIILETFLLFLQPYPFLNHVKFGTYDLYGGRYFEYKLNHIFCLSLMCRLYVVIRVLLRSSRFATTRAIRLGRMFGCNTGHQYTIKCIFKETPMILLSTVLLLSVFYLAWALRISERPLSLVLKEYYPSEYINIDKYLNCMWCIVITMATVGYGEYYPKTLIGRTLIIFIATWGIFTISIMVVVLTNTFQLSTLEQRALIVLKCVSAKQELRQKAALIITLVTRLKYQKYGSEKEAEKATKSLYKLQIKKRMELKNFSKQLRVLQRNLRNLYEQGNFNEQMARMFEQLNEDLKALIENHKKMNIFVNAQCQSIINDNLKSLILQQLKEGEYNEISPQQRNEIYIDPGNVDNKLQMDFENSNFQDEKEEEISQVDESEEEANLSDVESEEEENQQKQQNEKEEEDDELNKLKS